MTSRVFIGKIRVIRRRLDDPEIMEISASMLQGDSGKIGILHESDIPRMEIPNRIIKMTKSKHVDDFFSTGKLRLGCFSSFKSHDNPEIGDPTEGSFLLVGRTDSYTYFSELMGGFNYYAFCCYHGQPDEETISRFGYDAAYRIKHPHHFAKAIKKAIKAQSFEYSKCIYGSHKVIVGTPHKKFNPNIISHQQLLLTNSSKYYLKPEKYSHQNEIRFLWGMAKEIHEPRDLYCPQAIQFCEKI